VAADDYQGAADALLAKSLGVKKVFILNDKEAYGLGVATNFKNAAVKLGIKVVGFTAWDGKATSYEALAVKIKSSGAQGMFLGGLICENGGKLIKDLSAGAPGVKIMAPDGFTPISATIQGAGTASNGMTVSVAGLPNNALKGAGKAFVKAFSAADHRAPDPYSVYAAQAADVLIQAIAQSNGTRADVTKQLFKVNLQSSILGNVSFNANGDVTSNPVTIYKVKGSTYPPYKVIVPPKALVKAA
jgi:branched-chain amino acid transport system substrate-binding protein